MHATEHFDLDNFFWKGDRWFFDGCIFFLNFGIKILNYYQKFLKEEMGCRRKKGLLSIGLRESL